MIAAFVARTGAGGTLQPCCCHARIIINKWKYNENKQGAEKALIVHQLRKLQINKTSSQLHPERGRGGNSSKFANVATRS